MLNTKGFGQRRHNAELKYTDIFDADINIGICYVSQQRCIETQSGAKAVQKPAQWLHDWCSSNSVTLHRCHHEKRNYFAMSMEAYVRFLRSEIEIDNPYAERLMDKASQAGLAHQIDLAQAMGRDFIETPFGNIRFNENGMVSMDDLAIVLGKTPDEMMATLESEDFQRTQRSKMGWS